MFFSGLHMFWCAPGFCAEHTCLNTDCRALNMQVSPLKLLSPQGFNCKVLVHVGRIWECKDQQTRQDVYELDFVVVDHEALLWVHTFFWMLVVAGEVYADTGFRINLHSCYRDKSEESTGTRSIKFQLYFLHVHKTRDLFVLWIWHLHFVSRLSVKMKNKMHYCVIVQIG